MSEPRGLDAFDAPTRAWVERCLGARWNAAERFCRGESIHTIAQSEGVAWRAVRDVLADLGFRALPDASSEFQLFRKRGAPW